MLLHPQRRLPHLQVEETKALNEHDSGEDYKPLAVAAALLLPAAATTVAVVASESDADAVTRETVTKVTATQLDPPSPPIVAVPEIDTDEAEYSLKPRKRMLSRQLTRKEI